MGSGPVWISRRARAHGSHRLEICDIQCWQTALNIQLPPDAGSGVVTACVKATSCTLAKTSDSNDGGPIVNIDAQLTYDYNNNNQLNDIALTDCTVFNTASEPPANQYGLQIVSGSNIRVIGGTYSNNSSSGGAGIAITGGCTDVRTIGANLQPTYPGAPNLNSQQYGLLISGNPNAVLVSGCDMTGYSGSASAVEVTGTPTELFITSCAGYNDRNTALMASGSALTSGVSAATCSNRYFGPSIISYVSSMPVTLHVFGQAIISGFGIIFLPSPYDSFHFSMVPSSFSWTGK